MTTATGGLDVSLKADANPDRESSRQEDRAVSGPGHWGPRCRRVMSPRHGLNAAQVKAMACVPAWVTRSGFRVSGLAACPSGWSRRASDKWGEQHQNEGGDAQDAVGDDDRQREVPFRRDGIDPGQRRAGGSEGAVHRDPARRHDQAQDGDGAQDGDRGPGHPRLIYDEIEDPQLQATTASSA